MRTQTDWAGIAPAVAERLLGEPNQRLSTRREARWGRKGSRVLNLESGLWKDFESGEGGGVIDLVSAELNLDKSAAAAWLADNGFIEKSARRGGFQPVSQPMRRPQRPYRLAKEAGKGKAHSDAEKRKYDARRRLLRQSWTPDATPVRAWLDRFRAWHPDTPLPWGIRWLPVEMIRRSRSVGGIAGLCAGAIAFTRARLDRWQKGGGLKLGEAQAMGMVFITADGDKSEPNKRTLNLEPHGAGGAVFVIGNPNPPDGVIAVCEGLKDGLVIASRFSGPVIVCGQTPSADALGEALSAYRAVLLFPDADEPHSAAAQAWRNLGSRILRYDGRAYSIPLADGLKDPGEAGLVDPLPDAKEPPPLASLIRPPVSAESASVDADTPENAFTESPEKSAKEAGKGKAHSIAEMDTEVDNAAAEPAHAPDIAGAAAVTKEAASAWTWPGVHCRICGAWAAFTDFQDADYICADAFGCSLRAGLLRIDIRKPAPEKTDFDRWLDYALYMGAVDPVHFSFRRADIARLDAFTDEYIENLEDLW